jgi:hypothetical protein
MVCRSAADDAIFGDILQSIGRDAGHVTAVLEALDAMSGGPFADLDLQRRDAIAAQLCETGGEALVYLTRIILQCYYRQGHAVAGRGTAAAVSQRLRGGTRGLVPLDPVRARPKLYRDAG